MDHAHVDDMTIREIGDEILDPRIHDDHGDPHRAALEDVDSDSKVKISTILAVAFLGFTAIPGIGFTLGVLFPISGTVVLDLAGNTLNLNWVAGSWSLAGSVAFVIAGQLSDYFGRKQVFMCGQTFLILGHIVGATAHSLGQLIAGMVLLGIGIGVVFVSYPSISEILPNKYRSIGLASTELQTLPWSTFGPLIGRALVEHATWRWNFYLGIISAVFAATGTFFFFNPPSKPIRDRTRWQIFRELDHLGLALYTAGITLFLLGLSWGGIQHPWKSAAVIAPLILGVVLLGLCIAWDFSGYPKRPIFPKRIFVMFREFVAVLAVMFVTGLVYISGASLIPLQIGYVWTSDPIKAGLYNICAGFGGSIGGVVLGSLIYRIKRVPLQFGVAITVQTLFTALLALVTPHRIAMGIVFQTLASIPFGWVLILCYVTVGLHIPQRDLGLAAGLVGASRFLGGAVGSTILFTIFDNKAATAVPQHVAAAATQLGYPVSKVPGLLGALSSGNSSELANVPSNVLLAAVDALKWGYNSAFVVTWLATIPFGVLALLFGVFIRDPSPYFTTHVAVKTGDEKQGKHHQSAEERGATEKEVPLPSHIEA